MKTLKVQCFSTVVLLMSFFFAIRAHAQITPTGDAYTSSTTPTTNYGAKTLLDVDAASQISYIQFDLASIPPGASVSQATLKLYVNSVVTAGSLNVDYVNGNWSEGTIDYSNAPPLGASIASGVEITTAEKNHYVLINVTPALVAWLNGSQANDGIALVANGSFNATFDSKENSTTSHPPELDVVFAGGGGGTITGVLTGVGSGLTGGGTSGTLNLSLLNTCAASQVLQWNGSGWACASVGAGTITGVTAGTDLTGGGTSGSITLNVDLTKVPQLGANTFFGTQAITGANLALDQTTGANDGVVTVGGQGFLHTCCVNISGATDNIFVGLSAGNFSLGLNAAANTSLGSRTLAADTTGSGNTAIGSDALRSNTTGTQNVALGTAALISNTAGSVNAAVGLAALDGNSTGNSNTAFGGNALSQNSTGSNNTALGAAAGNPGNANTSGSNNTFVGYKSGPGTATQLSNATAIGANALVSENNALVLGGTGANAVNVGVGTATPASTLDVHGTGNFTGLITFAAGQTFSGTGTVTSVGSGTGLTGGPITGSGTLSIAPNACAAGNALSALPFTCSPFATPGSNTFTGNQTVNGNVTATNVTATQSVSGGVVNATTGFDLGGNLFALGSYANQNAFLGFAGNTTMMGNQNTAIGYAALASDTSGAGNTASGWAALELNTTGGDNMASGDAALELNTTGSFNTAAGSIALQLNKTGNNNTATGYGALSSNTGDASGNGSYNTASGAVALGLNTTGDSNTASGYGALYANTTGSGNTAVGRASGYTFDFSPVTGSSNTLLGYSSGLSTGTLSNATAIGAYAEVAASNSMVLGSINGVEGATANTLVGIGTTAPNALLHIGNTGGAPASNWFLRVEGPATAGTGASAVSVGGDGIFGIDAPGVKNGRFVVYEQGAGLVGINTPSPDATLTVNGSADKPSGGSWGTYSDGRLKNVDGGFRSGLDQVLKLRPVRYRYKADNALGISDHEEHIGVVAQEVQRVLPEAVSENNKGYLLVNNDPIIWAMLNAIKEQQQEIKALRKQVAELKRERAHAGLASLK